MDINLDNVAKADETQTALNGKVDKVTGKGLSDENYTLTEKNKLASITEIFTTALKNSYDSVVSWVSTYGANVETLIDNTSGTNTGDETQTTIVNKLDGSDLSVKSLNVTGTNGAGHVHLKHQATDAAATGSSTVIYADVNGDIKTKNDGKHYTIFKSSLNTADRVYTFQDKDGTIADLEDLEILQPFAILVDESETIDFITPKIYGTATVYKTGDFVFNKVNAKIGVLQKVFHLDSVVPNFGIDSICISGEYKINELNIIYFEYSSINRIEYRIIQQFSTRQIRRKDLTNNILYCGFANEGSLEVSNVWTITKIEINLNGSVLSKVTLTGVAWSDRGIIF